LQKKFILKALRILPLKKWAHTDLDFNQKFDDQPIRKRDGVEKYKVK
jgi:hypothetical protein